VHPVDPGFAEAISNLRIFGICHANATHEFVMDMICEFGIYDCHH
jgi:hypothetical protein